MHDFKMGFYVGLGLLVAFAVVGVVGRVAGKAV